MSKSLTEVVEHLRSLPGNGWNELSDPLGELQAMRGGWQPIETAPRDGTLILGYCDHEADPYYIGDGQRLTDYGANAEGLTHVEDGVQIILWHGPIDEVDGRIPPWWCAYWDEEVAANPTHWMPLPAPPGQKQEQPQ